MIFLFERSSLEGKDQQITGVFASSRYLRKKKKKNRQVGKYRNLELLRHSSVLVILHAIEVRTEAIVWLVFIFWLSVFLMSWVYVNILFVNRYVRTKYTSCWENSFLEQKLI